MFWHSFLTYLPTSFFWLVRSGAVHSARELCRWGPTLPAPLGSSPGEVRRCPLRSWAPGWGPALPTAICGLQLRSGAAHCNILLAKMTAKRRTTQRRRRRTALIKSNNPHLTGGEKYVIQSNVCTLNWWGCSWPVSSLKSPTTRLQQGRASPKVSSITYIYFFLFIYLTRHYYTRITLWKVRNISKLPMKATSVVFRCKQISFQANESNMLPVEAPTNFTKKHQILGENHFG